MTFPTFRQNFQNLKKSDTFGLYDSTCQRLLSPTNTLILAYTLTHTTYGHTSLADLDPSLGNFTTGLLKLEYISVWISLYAHEQHLLHTKHDTFTALIVISTPSAVPSWLESVIGTLVLEPARNPVMEWILTRMEIHAGYMIN